jgi:hypothetical protein
LAGAVFSSQQNNARNLLLPKPRAGEMLLPSRSAKRVMT